MASKSIGIGLIGQKFMGRAHSNAWSQAAKFFDLPVGTRLAVVSARDRKELAAFAERFGWAKSTPKWESLADDSDVDLVDIGTPNHLHAEQALRMLEAGKHVACEKPLARTLAEARVLRDAAAAAGKKVKTFVWHNYRRAPAIGLAWNLMREGRLGKIFHVRARYLQSWGAKSTPMSWRYSAATAGSGAHGDLNAHLVDLTRFLMGEAIVDVHGAVAPTYVTSRVVPGTKRRERCDVDDAALFLATFEGGAVASFEATRLAEGHLNDNTVEINGERGSLRWSLEDMNVLEWCDAEAPPRLRGWTKILATSAGNHPYAAAWWPDGHIIGYEHGFTNMAADILRVLGGKKPELPLPDFADAYETCRVLEAALLSAKHRCAVAMNDVP